MSIAKFKVFNSPDVMKTEEGSDSLDSIIRQAMGKEPVLSFSRPGNCPVQWIQYLHTLDSQELPGWPFLAPVKNQLQNCDKCSREFSSTINYRRHIQAYHRLKRIEKDFAKNRELLAAFWDKLSSDEAKEVVSFKNDLFEEVPGSASIKNLTALIRKPGFSGLPLAYLKTGSALLDIVQGRPSRFPILSRELFGILDDASEKTFLCCTVSSMQKYIFDGEAAKIYLETKNLVAYMSLLVEQKLVKAWLADKDAEALRCQKLLVEEEEAAQKRHAELLERKKQKKLRQKEQKAKEQGLEECVDDNGTDQMSDIIPFVDLSNPTADCKMGTHDPEIVPDHVPPSFEAFELSNALENPYFESHMEFSGYPELNTNLNDVLRKTQKSGHKQLNSRSHLLPKSQGRWTSNDFHSDQNSQASRISVAQNHGSSKQLKSAPLVNGNKVWSRKSKLENNGDRCKVTTVQKEEAINVTEKLKWHEVLIGSISVTLGNCGNEDEKSILQEKALKCDSTTSGTNNVTAKLWRPVSRNGSKRLDEVKNVDGESKVDLIASNGNDRILLNENNIDICRNSTQAERSILPASGLPFSSETAKAFLSQRWKEAMMAEHVKLVLSPIEELEFTPRTSKMNKSIDVAREEKHSKILGSRSAGVTKPKLRAKPEKNTKIRYIPKQRSDCE